MEFHVFQSVSVPSFPFTGFCWEESGSTFFIRIKYLYTSIHIYMHRFPSETSLFKAGKSQLCLSWYVRCSDPLIILVDLGQTHSSTSISNKRGLWSRAYTVCMQCKKPALFSSHLFWPFHIPAGIVARECFRKDLHVVKCMDSHCFEECL